MWLFTTIGFFSIVQKPGDGFLTVRSRVAGDLDRLRKRYMPKLSKTITGKGTDYPFRATINHNDFAQGLNQIVQDLHYSNFKNEVAEVMGIEREMVYAKVWTVMRGLESEAEKRPKSKPGRTSSSRDAAYGGVVFNDQGDVLLREPKNHFDGYVWTFAKGRPDDNETPEDTALREVFQETGVKAQIEGRIPGIFAGGTTDNIYYLMSVIEETGKWDLETARICWVAVEEAKKLIRKTTNKTGRQRDLDVLEAAEEFRQQQ